MRALILALGLLGAAPVSAQPLTTTSPCGGDAFSSAQVIENRPPRHGPLIAMPDTLCADIAPQQPQVDLRIDAYPIVVPPVGTGRRPAPY